MRATASRRIGGGADREPGLSALSSLLLRESRALAADYALLAVLDARRAVLALAWLLSLALVIAVLGVTAWLTLVTGGVVWLVGSGAAWPWVLVAAAGLNLVACGAVALWARRYARELPFAATLRQIKGEPPPAEGAS